MAAPEGASVLVPGLQKVPINLWIPAALLRGSGMVDGASWPSNSPQHPTLSACCIWALFAGPEAYHVYQVVVQIGHEEWSVFRRYTHFCDLHKCEGNAAGEGEVELRLGM